MLQQKMAATFRSSDVAISRKSDTQFQDDQDAPSMLPTGFKTGVKTFLKLYFQLLKSNILNFLYDLDPKDSIIEEFLLHLNLRYTNFLVNTDSFYANFTTTTFKRLPFLT